MYIFRENMTVELSCKSSGSNEMPSSTFAKLSNFATVNNISRLSMKLRNIQNHVRTLSKIARRFAGLAAFLTCKYFRGEKLFGRKFSEDFREKRK